MTLLPDRLPPNECTKVWTTLITNTKYLTGLLTLEYSLRNVNSEYPLVVLYTDTFEPEGHAALDRRGIYKQRIPYLLPKAHKDYTQDVRFYDCWSKLQPFSLTEFERVVQLDSDMVVVRNMDELMDDHCLPLDNAKYIFAASHACVCNPYKKPHYPANWHSGNCAYTKVRATAESKENDPSATLNGDSHTFISGPPTLSGLGICNGGLQVVRPSKANYEKIIHALENPDQTNNYDFADQSLLSDVFEGRWFPLSYKYNALKTLKSIHSSMWDDSEVKNVHYILNPKPWDVRHQSDRDLADDTDTFQFWFEIDDKRVSAEKQLGINDGF